MEPPLVKWSLRVLRWIDAHVFRAWRCSVCGCTDHFACVDGCGWCSAAPEHICTSCALADPSLVMVEREHRIAKLERELDAPRSHA